VHSESDTIVFHLATAASYSGQLPVYARWVNATLVFNYEPANTGPGGILGLSDEVWAGIVILLVVAIIVGVIAYRRSRRSPPSLVLPPPPANP